MNRRIFPAVLALGMLGCGQQSEVTTTLQAVLAAAQIALPLIPNVPPTTQAQIRKYIGAVSDGVSKATVILGGTESAPVKAAQITKAFADITQPTLPPGTAQNVVQAVGTISFAVGQFLQATGAAEVKAAQQPVDITSGDRRALPKIQKAATEINATVRK